MKFIPWSKEERLNISDKIRDVVLDVFNEDEKIWDYLIEGMNNSFCNNIDAYINLTVCPSRLMMFGPHFNDKDGVEDCLFAEGPVTLSYEGSYCRSDEQYEGILLNIKSIDELKERLDDAREELSEVAKKYTEGIKT